MNFITKRRLASLVSASAMVATLAMATMPSATLAAPSSTTGRTTSNGYSAIPSKVSGNVASIGFEATSTKEFGDAVALGGPARKLSSMSVVFSSWASESGAWNTGDALTTPGATFDVPITFNIYENSNGVKGERLATKTQTVAMAYRPSTSDLCTGGKWWSSKDKACYNGMIQMVTMPMPSVDLPDEVIWTVQYDTNHYGPNPTTEPTPADSLNVGASTFGDAAFVGTDLSPGQVFEDSTYLDGSTGWTANRPLGSITTK